MDEGRLRKWSISLYRSSAGNLKGGGAPSPGTLIDMYRQTLERGPVGDQGRDAPLPGLCEKGEILFIRRPYFWGIQEICKRRLWKRETFSIGTLLGNLEGGFIYWGL